MRSERDCFRPQCGNARLGRGRAPAYPGLTTRKRGCSRSSWKKVNKANAVIQKGTRNQVNFKKSQKDVAKNAKELVKLAKEAKLIKSAVKNAKDLTDPDKKWEEMMEDFIKTSDKLYGVANKADAPYQKAKDAFGAVKKLADQHGLQGRRELGAICRVGATHRKRCEDGGLHPPYNDAIVAARYVGPPNQRRLSTTCCALSR